MNRGLLLSLCVVAVVLAHVAPTRAAFWVGMSPEVSNPSIINLVRLQPPAKPTTTIASVHLTNPNEQVSVDSFRCMPYGSYCAFTTSNGTDAWLYNVTVADGSVQVTAHLPGITLHNLSLYTHNNAAITIALAPNYAVVIMLFPDQIVPLVDISEYLGESGFIAPGAETQCSDTNTMWVHIQNTTYFGALGDLIVALNLETNTVENVFPLTQLPTVASMWASCNDATGVNQLGGTAMSGNTVGYGTIDTQGNFHPTATMTFPTHSPAYQITALLSEPIGYDFFFAVYPQGSTPGGPPTSGYLVFGDFDKSSLTTVEVDYYLTGAGRIS